jgi:indole-3-glycerol phosphate synthase
MELVREVEPALNFGDALLPAPAGSTPALPRIIAECKQKSPSRGIMCDPYDPVQIAKSYELNGAAAISVLTDEQYFGGHLSHLINVTGAVNIPVLRKDFIVDEYQVYEARAAGADTFLLLAGLLDTAQLQYLIEVGRELGMEPLIESHDSQELAMAMATDGLIIGINNRNLKTFSVTLENAKALADQARVTDHPRILVCESGIRTAKDIEIMTAVGYNAFLIGEALVSTPDPGQSLSALISALCAGR